MDQGGYLTELKDEFDEYQIDFYLKQQDCYWIGLSDKGHEGRCEMSKRFPLIVNSPPLGQFIWGSSHEVADYTNWARSSSEGDTDEPNGGEAENCVFKTLNYVGGSTPGWADYSCGERYAEGMPCYALCTFASDPLPTRPSTTSTPAPTTATTSSGNIEDVF